MNMNQQKNQTIQEKTVLIESMKSMVRLISENHHSQKQIFDQLTTADFKKIINNLSDSNQSLRRISALILCQLLLQNEELKHKALNLLDIKHQSGRICFNSFPLRQASQINRKKILKLLKTPPLPEEEKCMCWFIDTHRKTPTLQHLSLKKYSAFTFIDPAKALFGFTCVPFRSDNNKVISSIPLLLPSENKNGEGYAQSPRSSSHNSFYREYFNSRKKLRDQGQLDSKLRQNYPSMNLKQKHIPMREKRNESNSQNKGKKTGTIFSISQYARDSYSKVTPQNRKIEGLNDSLSHSSRDMSTSLYLQNIPAHSEIRNQKGYMTPRVSLKTEATFHQTPSSSYGQMGSVRGNYSTSYEKFMRRIKEMVQ